MTSHYVYNKIVDKMFLYFFPVKLFDVNKNFQLYFYYKMAIYDSKQSKVQDFVVTENKQLTDSDEPLCKIKVCSLIIYF